ncbi:PAS domain-containing protein [Rhizobium tubonense]|uniref:histidine kinase n=1 Tax=Rhizobium tubonense TaxID=484088 RepID=A0A2W4CSJ3_9HYPH|nr:PAS domain-containing protein [Rhizobium tubonense]PZM15399.1 PAS domain-containing sensor histidine kinase [Rhizobium tubonense]
MDLGRILDSLPGMALTATPEGRLTFLNREWSDFTGLGVGGDVQWQAMVSPDDLPALTEQWHSLLALGKRGRIDACLKRFDGRHQRFAVQCNPVQSDEGRIAYWLALATEIDERSSERPGGDILNDIPAGIAILGRNGELEAINDHLMRYLGASGDEVKLWKTADFVHAEDLPRAIEAITQAVADGEAYDMDIRLREDGGNYRWFQVCGNPRRDKEGHVLQWYALHIDIDERKRAEEALRTSETNLRDNLNALPTTAWSTSPNGYVDFLNARWLDYSGFTAEQASGYGWGDVIHPDDAERLFTYWQGCLASGDSVDIEARMRRFDGEYRWFLFRADPLRAEDGTIIKWFGTNIDIEDRKRAEEELRASERNLAQIINTIPTIAWSTLPDGYTDFLHHRWLEYAGMSAEEAEGWGWSNAIHPDDLPGLADNWRRCLATGIPNDAEARIRRFDGEYRWFLFRGSPLRDEAGSIVKWYGTNVDIEDRKRAEEALAESERQSRLIVDTIPGLVSIFGRNGETEGINEQFLEYLGQTLESFENWRDNGTVHPDDLQHHVDAFARSLMSGNPMDFETRLKRHDGTYRWFHLRGNPARDPDGHVVRWYCLMTDIDDRKRAEEAVRESEVTLRRIINTLPTTAWATSPNGFVEFLSDRWLNYAGVTWEQAAGFGWGDVIHPDDAGMLFSYWQGCLESGERVDVEARMRRYDGAYRWFLFRANPLRDENGTIVKWYGTNIDIEDRKNADEALRESERYSRLIVDTIPGMIALFAPDGELTGANHQLLEYFDQPLEAVKDWATNGMTHPDDLQSYVEAFTLSIKSGEPYEIETRLLRYDGHYRWFQIRGLPLYDGNGNVIRWYGLLTDIDDRKRAEEELRRSEAFLADAQRVSGTGSFAWVLGSETVTCSDETYRIYGFDPAEPVTVDLIRGRTHPENYPTFQQVMDRSQQEGSDFDYETKLLMPDQLIKYVRVVAHNERNKDGELELRGAVRDVTASRLAEEALSKARADLARVARITSLGILTASIAHEVNQPLSGIVTNADTCLRMLAEDPPNIEVAMATARRTIRDGNRAADVIARLRALFSKNPFTIEPVDLSEAVREVMVLSRGDIQRGRIVLRTELSDDLPPAAGDRVQLQQVILNLLRNATEAMVGINDRPRRLTIRTERDGDDHIRFAVEDAGVGFEANETDRVFEAFYSTKSDGMGIGLSVSRSIIESHNGRLCATVNDGPGVTVSFAIPIYTGNEASVRHVAHTSPKRSIEARN